MLEPSTFHAVSSPGAGRLDRYLATLAFGLTRSRLRQLIDVGLVTVDGRPARPSHQLRGGEAIRVEVPPAEPLEAAPEELPLELVYDDPWLAVVSKPRGLVVHPAPGHPAGTLVNALLHHCRDLAGIGGRLRPGIVHRLDKDTSGLLVVAKDDDTLHALQDQFQRRSVRKVYLAVVLGTLEGEGTIDGPIGRHPSDRKKMAVDGPGARAAVTRWKRLQPLRGATLVEVKIETGRTHQIRVHLASIGHPVAGDPVYGGAARAKGVADPGARRRLTTTPPQALHAWKLGFRHPHNGEELDFTGRIPDELVFLIEALGGSAPGFPLTSKTCTPESPST